ncbi:MAG: M23 family metallopeptidase [Candidatus Daviesbacteria bacterium]|nr:M23 family metallopeptidase [Candidatus Daviesbacteria bacterium]
MNSIKDDLRTLCQALIWYTQKKTKYLAARFEELKNFLVELLMQKRGARQKQVWHGSIIGLASVGIITSGIIGGQSLISSTYPGIGGPDPRFTDAFEPFPNGPLVEGFQDIHTEISQKPRSETLEYEVESGDTLSSIAKKFGISTDTIRWENNLKSDQIKPGDTVNILPLSGVSHKVVSGDTLESVAKKYSANAQAIVDFPFNDVPDDFSLRVGQILIIPDGVPPEVKVRPSSRPQPQYLAQGPSSPTFDAPFGASFIWPVGGQLSQYFAWYHPGIDIANRSAPGIAASDGGVVVVAGWPDGYGYGNRVVIDHGNGYRSLYAHLSNIYVSVGERASRGQLIGQMGSTGRSTGTHLHFEIHFKGVAVNPLAILK